jgi:reverse gyrase 2
MGAIGMDKEIRKIAEAIAEKINDISMEETEIIDNCKEIRKLSKTISEKKEILRKIENGEIRKLNMTSISYDNERVQGGKRRYRSSIEKLEDLKEKIMHEIDSLENELAGLVYGELCFIETFWDY